MRRTLFLTLGSLELFLAVILVVLSWTLPSQDEVHQGFDHAERVTHRVDRQVQILREQVGDLRQQKFQDLATRVQKQTRTIAVNLQSQQVDFNTVRTMRNALADFANGLDAIAATLGPDNIDQLGTGLARTADYLEQQLIPAAEKAADYLDQSTELLKTDAERLRDLARTAPLNLKAARDVYQSLGAFGDGLDKMNGVLELQQLKTMREGAKGLEESLRTGAESVERLSTLTYPVVNLTGLKPEVTQQKFWPEGDKIADGLKKAAGGIQALDKEMAGMARDLPKLRAALAESRKMVQTTRAALGKALEQQDQLDNILKNVPEHAARLAEDLPRLGGALAGTLRDTKQLQQLAASLRQVQKGLDAATGRRPQLRTTLTSAARLLRASRTQLDGALANRDQYQTALQQSVVLADALANMLPMLTRQFDSRLDEEEEALESLSQSLHEANRALPAYEQTVVHLLQAGRFLGCLVAAIIALHGCHLLLSVFMGRRYSL